MVVRRVLTLLIMAILVTVSGTSLAAAMCVHSDAAAHEAAARSDDGGEAAIAHLEEAADASASKRGTVTDAGSLLMQAFVIPDDRLALLASHRTRLPRRQADDPPGVHRSVAPLLQPPAA